MPTQLQFRAFHHAVTSATKPLSMHAPLTLALMAWVPVTFDPWKWAGAGLATTVIAYFVSQITRDAGKKLEAKLWADWGGGTPSAVFLRHGTPGAHPNDKAELHRALQRLNPSLHFPSPAEEAEDPGAALGAYERAAAWLRSQTRDPKRFPLILEENISYGFRRNLLALRSWGLLSSAICVGSAGVALWAGRDTLLHLIGGALVGGYAPLLDRIDLVIEVPAVTAADLILPAPAEGSAEVAARVARARSLQVSRYKALNQEIGTNAACPGPLLEEVAQPDAEGMRLLREAADAMRLTARGFHRILKVARTLADLDGEPKVRRLHLAEAISYRSHLDRRPVAA
jgi:hypothetical protein